MRAAIRNGLKRAGCGLAALALLTTTAFADISRFLGEYEGMAQIVADNGDTSIRNMSVTITEIEGGFSVAWTSERQKANGALKTKSYEIDFRPSDRDGIFAAAQKKNIFGHAVQLDPMKGEPYVWAQLSGETLSVYSMFVTDEGGYEIQQYDRTLADGGLDLNFRRTRDGQELRTVSTFLKRQ